MSDLSSQTQSEDAKRSKDESSASSQDENSKANNDNSIGTCAGGLTDEQTKTLQEELDRAKESDSFSSNSLCSIV